jgi:predicted nucleic acid-binding protein
VSVVIDASVTLAWYFDDEATPGTEAVLDQVSVAGAIVPSLWRLEVANGFQSAVRRNRIAVLYRDRCLAELAQLAITVDPETDRHAWTTTLRLAEHLGLTVYDAAYLEAAQRLQLPLATLDKALHAAAAAVSVPLFGPQT